MSIPAFQSIEVTGISKSFSGVTAVRDVSFSIRAGEAVGLVGENGAGKTTLMNCLTGLYYPDKGTIRVNGNTVRIRSARDAFNLGIGMVHQHFMLVPSLTVLENIALGLDRSPRIRPLQSLRREFMSVSRRFGLDANPDAAIRDLSAGERQRVEILRVLMRGAGLLILDEPTSVLTPNEVDGFFTILNRLIAEGCGVFLISHKLDEILDICSRIIVLRHGSLVAESPTEALDPSAIAVMMVGDTAAPRPDIKPPEPGRVILEIRNIDVTDDRDLPALHDVSLTLRSGEILGVAGISGNGQRELAEVITGLRPIRAGSISINGKDLAGASPRDIMNAGVSYIPEDRLQHGCVGAMTVSENTVMRTFYRYPASQNGILRRPVIRSIADDIVTRFDVSTPSIDTPVRWLSGGNIQKLIAGRELSASPMIVIASHPTCGLDVRAAGFIRSMLLDCRDRGGAVVLLSEDLDEVFLLATRITVLFRGQLTDAVHAGEVDRRRIGLWMAGATETQRDQVSGS